MSPKLRGAACVIWDGSPVGSGCSTGTRFQIASVSKHFAAVSALMLVGRGVLRLDEPIARWLGYAPDTWQPARCTIC